MAEPHATETHVSTLFFSGDRVFKLLKPVVTGFLDHTSTSARLTAADAELRLNRRLAPDVYLGTADVVEQDEIVDRMIVMRRLPSDRSLTNVIAVGALTDDHLRSIARAIAAFHGGLEPIIDQEGPGSLRVQRQNWLESFDEIASFVGPVLDPEDERMIEVLVTSYLDGHESLFGARVDDGFVRDGHGDLLADDIFCLDDGPRILDCLAFHDRFRIGDVLSDIAFLAMDLHRLAGPEIATAFVRHYCEFSGERHPSSLAHHYLAYRAFVRCKIACLRVGQGAPEFGAVARMYHRLALDQLGRARTRLVLVGGGPGTGKTSVAARMGTEFSVPVLSSDDVRKDLANVDKFAHEPAEPDAGIYTQESTTATYAELIRRAEMLLDAGESVVIDASWTRDEHRQLARTIAQKFAAQLTEIECTVDIGIARERVARRLADGWDPSDATPEIVDHLRTLQDPWPEATSLDTSRPMTETIEHAVALVLRATTSARHPDFWGTYRAFGRLDPSRPFAPVNEIDEREREKPNRAIPVPPTVRHERTPQP